MQTLMTMLRDADPLRHEPIPSGAVRERVRRTMLAAAADDGALLPRWSRRSMMAAAAGGGIVLAAGALWLPAGGRVHAAAIRLEIRLADVEPIEGWQEASLDSGRRIYLHPTSIVANEDIEDSRVAGPDDQGRYSVVVRLTAAAGERLASATAGHLGRPLAILLDGEVVLAPVVRSAISTTAIVSGDFTRAEAERIADGILRW